GKVFLDASKEILELYNGIHDRFNELQNKVAGTLRIATVFSLGLHELPPFVKEFRRLYPKVDLKIDYIRSSQVYSEVLEGNADLGIVAYPNKRKGVTIEEFAQDKMVLICPPDHPLAKRKTARLDDLADQKFVSFEPDLPTRKALDKALKNAGVAVRREMEFDNIETVKRAVEIENGISIVPSRSVENEVKNGRLISVDIRSEDMKRPLGLVQKRTRATSPAMREFIALLKERK
ncbi:MAG: LysR family transcriptional regulator substrate-binding protein, partial [Verrucomicrobiales bacterium]